MLMKIRKNKKGFTLAELLIVIAIIAVLIAIAIPVYNSQLTNAQNQVDAANMRSAKSIAYAQYLTDLYDSAKTSVTASATVYYVVNLANDNMTVGDAVIGTQPTAPATGFLVTVTAGAPTVAKGT